LKKQLSQKQEEKENVNSNGRENFSSTLSLAQNGETMDIGGSENVQQNLIMQLSKKYDMAKRLCNLRNDDISKLNQQVAEMTEQIAVLTKNCDTLSSKYTRVKEICEYRLEKLNILRSEKADLQKKLGITPSPELCE
jgi:hypothetical protein